jgi:hypothetical protein
MKRLAVIISAILILSLLPSPPAQAWEWKKCGSTQGSGAGWYKVRAHNVGCRVARRVARRWEAKCVWGDGCPNEDAKVRAGGFVFRCDTSDAGYESVKVRCTARGARVVRFYWGS